LLRAGFADHAGIAAEQIESDLLQRHAVDAGEDVAISVTLYQDRAAADAAIKAARPWAEANLVHLMGATEATVGEVVVSCTGITTRIDRVPAS